MIILFIWTFFVVGIRGHHFMENCQVFSRLGIVLILKLWLVQYGHGAFLALVHILISLIDQNSKPISQLALVLTMWSVPQYLCGD